MLTYEKILIAFILLLVVLQFLIGSTSLEILLALVIWLLAASYFIGGYWLLNPKEDKKYLIPIVSGIAFASSLLVLPYTIRLKNEPILEILPLLNAGLFGALVIYLVFKRDKAGSALIYKDILIRSGIIFMIVGFLTYTPSTFKPYRDIIIGLNKSNDRLVSNMQMFHYAQMFEEALNSGDCDRAIITAEKANESGKAWLGIDIQLHNSDTLASDSSILNQQYSNLDTNLSSPNQLWRISGTLGALYEAYICKADKYYNNNNYSEALAYYLKAYTTLTTSDYKLEYWNTEQAYLLNAIALCHKDLNNYKYADSFFIEAINRYRSIQDTVDRDIAIFFSNLAESLAEQNHLGQSNKLYKASIKILQTDTSNEDNINKAIQNYHKVIENLIYSDSLVQALYYIEETFSRVDNNTVDFCHTQLYQGLCYYKWSKYNRADKVLTECLECYRKLLDHTNQNIAENHFALALVKLSLADYESARYNLDRGIEITAKNYGKSGVRYASYLRVYANLNKVVGNYEQSEQQYYQVLDTYINEFEEKNGKMSEALSGLADLEIILSKLNQAKSHSDSSVLFAKELLEHETPGLTSLLNNAAHVNYHIGLFARSDSLYRKTIKINKNYGLQSLASTASALNGLALLMTAKRQYKSADSLFLKSLKQHKEIYTKDHPYTAIVYLNYAKLQIEVNNFADARDMLAQSQDINKKFFNPGHDIFADIYVAYGDLTDKEGLDERSKDYYQKALNIYLQKFNAEHINIKSTREKLKQ